MARRRVKEPVPYKRQAPAQVPAAMGYPRGTPTTDADLHDKLLEMFGFGDYEEGPDAQPYWQWRMDQITRLKASLRKRNVAREDLWLAALYCREQGVTPMHFTWLYQHITPALKWWKAELARRAQEEFDTTYERALAWEARNHPDGDWYVRLVRATDRREVLVEWRLARLSQDV